MNSAAARTGEVSTSGRSAGVRKTAFAHEEGHRELYRLMNAVVRGAGAGFCLKGGLHILSWLLALISKSRRQRLTRAPLKTLLEQFLDTVRYTLFLGSLGGVYVGVDEGIANTWGRQR